MPLPRERIFTFAIHDPESKSVRYERIRGSVLFVPTPDMIGVGEAISEEKSWTVALFPVKNVLHVWATDIHEITDVPKIVSKKRKSK